jgi:hypothetical protein
LPITIWMFPPPATNYFDPGGGNNYGIDFAELNPNLVVRTYYTSGRSGNFSTNSGSTWTQCATEPAAATNGPGVVVISADGSRLVWAIPGSPSFYSTNNGTTWTQSAGANPTMPYSWEQPYPFSDRVNSNKFYVYMPDSGIVYVSTNGGASFFAGATLTAWADSTHATFGQEGNLWVAIYNGLWCSTNSAGSFFQVPGVQAAHTVGFGKSKSSGGYRAMYLHGEINNTWGVYRSDDQAATWTRINDDQHQYGGIAQVIGDPKIYGRCYIAALGIVYGDLPNQPPFTPTGLTASPSNAAVSLTWNSAALAGSYMVGRSTISGGPYTNIASGVTATTYRDTSLVNGTTYYYVVAATNAYGASSNSVEVSATLLPLPWLTQDIGAVGIDGSAIYTNGVFAVTGAGADIQGTADAFRFIYLPAPGDCTIIARVVSVQNVDPWSKAGVMIRQSFDAGAANAFVALTPGNGVTWQYRSSIGGGTSRNQTTSLNNAYWFKLVRNGSTFTGYRSPDGTNWTEQGTTTITMSNNVIVGLALTSHSTSRLGTATFDNVTAPGWPISPLPSAPTGLAVIAGNAEVALSWSASATATNYHVKLSATSGSGYAAIATNASFAFTNTGLVNGTLYYYVVSAVNSSGEGSNSTEVSALPTSSAPTQLGFATFGNQLQLHWPADHTGWQLQSQTNYLAVGLGTNWVNVSGSAQTNQMPVPLSTTNGAVFFRLARP